MSGPQHKPESRCLPVSCGPGMPGPQLTGKHLLSGLCCGPDMSGPQHKPESRCLPVSCGPGMPGPQLTGKHLLSGLCCGPDMSGPQHKPESRCLPVSCGPGMPGPYISTMFLPCNNGTRPRNGQDRSLQSTRGPRSVGRGLDPSAAAVCHCDAVGAGHVRPAT